MPSNEVYIETAMDTKALERGIKITQKELAGLEKHYQSLQDKQRRYLELGGQKQELSAEYKKASAEVDRLTNSFNNLLTRREKMETVGTKTNSRQYKSLEEDIKRVETQLISAEKAKEALESTKYVDTAAWSKMTYDISQTESKVENAKIVLSEYQSQLEQFKSGVNNTKMLKRAFDKLKGSVRNFGKGVGSAFSGLAKFFKKTGSLLASFRKNSNSAFGGGFKKLFKYSLGIRSLFILFNKLRSALVEGFKNLAQWNDGNNAVNRALSNLKSSLTQLKNSFTTAFVPVLIAIEPILTRLVDKISQVATAVGMLIAKLTGATQFTRAVKVQENYAESLGSTAKNAKNAKKQLSALDSTLNVLTSDQDADSGVSPNNMFETVNIPSMFDNMANKLKDAWANADFTDIGAIVGQKLRDGLNNIPWNKIHNTARKIGTSFATLINGFVKVPKLATTIGSTIAQAFNSALYFVQSFVKTLDWESVGRFISDGIISFVTTIDWVSVGDTIYEGIKGAFELAWGLLDPILTALGFDIESPVPAFFETLSNAVTMFKQALEILKPVWDYVWNNLIIPIGNFAGEIFIWFLQETGDLFSRLGDLFTEKGGKIQEILIAVAKVFELQWTTKIKPVLQFIMGAIGELLDYLVNIVADIIDVLYGVVEFLTGVFTGDWKKAWQGIKDIFKGIFNGIIDIFEGVCNTIIAGINNISVTVPSWIPKYGGQTIGFDIAKLNLPRLATGTVVPRQSSEFMAVLGDNKQETEVVSPLSTMKQAMLEALRESGVTSGGNDGDIVIEIDGNEVFRVVRKQAKEFKKQTGLAEVF